MSNPRFPDPFGRRELLEPGATASGGGLSLEQRVAALEQGAASKTRPILYYASMYVANSGAPTHTSSGGWQKVGSGGGTVTWTSEFDVRPAGVSAQVDTATNKRIDIRQSGIYLVSAMVMFSSISDAKTSGVAIRVNGSEYAQGFYGNGKADLAAPHVTIPLSLTSGQYVELFAYQEDSASEAYLVSGTFRNRLSVMYIGPSV